MVSQLGHRRRPEPRPDPEHDVLLLLQRPELARDVGAAGRAAVHLAEVGYRRFPGNGELRSDFWRARDGPRSAIERVQVVVPGVAVDLKHESGSVRSSRVRIPARAVLFISTS